MKCDMKHHDLQGLIDMHIHSAPDIRQRKMNDLELMEAAVKLGVRGIVIKSHNVPTADRATLVNMIKEEKYGSTKDFTMYGSLVLNQPVGGLNPYAVEKSLKLGAKVIWLPTNTASNHLAKQGKSGGIEVVRDGKTVPELEPIFRLISEYDVVLGTGHISADECFAVAEGARKAGVKKIVITHPEFWIVGMSLLEQEQIVRDYDVLLERVYAQPLSKGVYKKNLPDNVAAMRQIGCEHFIVSTDGGQMQNPPWYETIQEYVDYLYESGLSDAEIKIMTRTNQEKLLNLK